MTFRTFCLGTGLKRFSLAELEQFVSKQKCPDSEVILWIQAYLEFKRKHQKEASALYDAAKNLTDKRLEQNEFARHFWISGATWDFREDVPTGPSKFEMFSQLATNPEFANFTKKKSEK